MKKSKLSESQIFSSIIVRIDDNGPGIPEEELEQVFIAFYRGEQSRSRDTGGVGLGLAVTRDIIESHNGKITLTNRRPHGLRAIIEIASSGSLITNCFDILDQVQKLL